MGEAHSGTVNMLQLLIESKQFWRKYWMVKRIQKISCSQAAGPEARIGTLGRVIQEPPSMGGAEKIPGHSSRLLGNDLHLEGMLCAEPHRAE